MDRREFFSKLVYSTLVFGVSKKIYSKNQISMPVVFIGHGSPMNAITTNNFTKALSELNKKIPKPKAILMISAHWITEGSFVTSMKYPKTIHDFGGFPEELYKVEYKAPGDIKLAKKIATDIKNPKIIEDQKWGLDHGTWCVLKHIYPKADIPVIQLSIDTNLSPAQFYDIGIKLNDLRKKGILIMGSGNLVHNLRDSTEIENSKVFPYATEFDSWVKENLEKKNHAALVNNFLQHDLIRKAHPSVDHYLPFIYTLGATNSNDKLEYIYEGFQNSSISMRSIIWS